MRKSEELSEQEDEEEEALEGEEGQENVVGEEDEAGGGGCAEWERRSERTAGDPSASAILEEESRVPRRFQPPSKLRQSNFSPLRPGLSRYGPVL